MKKVTCPWFRGLGFILSWILFPLSPGLFAQESAGEEFGARIYHAEGTDFILAVGEQRNIYRPDSLGAGGLTLNPRDMIQTAAGSFVELQLIPGGTVIKAAENTSVVFNSAGGEGAPASFDLLYGRIRIIRGAEEGNRDLVVQSGNAVVHVREGDIGLDYILRPGLSLTGNGISLPLLRIYGFSGIAELVPRMTREGSGTLSPAGDSGGEQALIRVKEGETLALEVLSGLSFTERKPLGRDIVDYWARNNFNGAPPLKKPESALVFFSDAPPDNQIRYTPPDYTSLVKPNRVKNWGIAAGLLFTAVGVGLQSYGRFRIASNKDAYAESLINAGFAPLGLGFLTLMVSLIPRSVPPAAYGAP
ncbi:MAG: FecR domain-containing protein [Treponema sp.]|jgi:hypothetical protein|nr:FecR domain-containing protein [Treponema sp.]